MNAGRDDREDDQTYRKLRDVRCTSRSGIRDVRCAFLGTLVRTLLDKNVITRVELMNIIGAARRDVSQIKVSTIHRDADLILAKVA